MKVPFVDLGAVHRPIAKETEDAIARVLESQHFILGPEVSGFEQAFSKHLGFSGSVLGTSSGTSALMLALLALDLRPEDEVIVPAYTFVATAMTVARTGATPVFVDVEEDSLNMDVSKALDAITPRTKAVVPVHLFGRMADVTALKRGLASTGRQIPIIEDTAQSQGASLEGHYAGTLGAIGCFSFFPAKNLGCFGDGGAVATGDADVLETMRCDRAHGGSRKYYHTRLGLNARLDAIQAAILKVRLPHVGRWIDERRSNASKYDDAFSELRALDLVRLPPVDDDRFFHSYNQ
ncbi:MAG: DegT/DnrJ/EryC1/StrS family aminotransferase, partial [Myxococcales bacterium]|nr:DegT/DnrJ/EryC1/StrS family aminotransferase [Myxococcales bacterium]